MASPQADVPRRDGPLRRAVDWVFGYDFFLSYTHGDGKNLPRRIRQRLEQVGFRVFLDQVDYVAGTDLPRETGRQVAKTKRLVVIGRPGALRSPWVQREVEAALAADMSPVVINVNGAIETAPADAPLAALIRSRNWLWLPETLADPDGEPSENTISELIRGFGYTRQETKRQRVFAIAALVLAVATGAAVWQAVEASRARVVAEAQRDRAQRVVDQIIATANRRVQALSKRARKASDAAAQASPGSPDTGGMRPDSAVERSAMEQATSLIARSAALVDEGDVKGARAPLQQAVAILERPETTRDDAQRAALFMALERLADVARRIGDDDASLAALQKCMTVSGEALASGGAATDWKRRRAASLQRAGELLLKRGDFAAAERSFQGAADELGALAADPAQGARAARDHAAAVAELGDLELARDQPDAALARYRESLAIVAPLAEASPGDAGLAHDVATFSQRISDAFAAAGKLDDALAWADKDIAVSEKLAAEAGAEHKVELLSSYDRRARALERLGRDQEALAEFAKGAPLIEMVANDDAPPSVERDAAAMLESKGKLLARLARPQEAIDAFRRALAIREGLAASYEDVAWQLELEAAYRRASETALRMNRPADALEMAEQYLLATGLATDRSAARQERVARALGTLCWSGINAASYPRALWACREAVGFAPDLDWIRINYAHALMLSGERERAREIYYSGLKRAPDAQVAWKASVRKDFDTLRGRGISDWLMTEVTQALGS